MRWIDGEYENVDSVLKGHSYKASWNTYQRGRRCPERLAVGQLLQAAAFGPNNNGGKFCIERMANKIGYYVDPVKLIHFMIKYCSKIGNISELLFISNNRFPNQWITKYFDFVRDIDPQFYLIHGRKRRSLAALGITKNIDEEVKCRKNAGWLKIWDCGHKLYKIDI